MPQLRGNEPILGINTLPPPKGGTRGILHLSPTHNISLMVGLGSNTNNLCEFMSLKLVLMLAREQRIYQIQIYGDSLLMIQWMKGEYNFPLFHDILLMKSMFSHIAFTHVYRDRNNEEDKLSKNGVVLKNGI
jgi:ribonuclease HI